MRIMIDGRVLAHEKVTGVERYAVSMISALGKLADEVIVAEPRTRSRLKQHIWEQVTLPGLAKRSGADVLFCPANLGPMFVRGPYRQVLVLHSVSFIECPESYSRFFRRYYCAVVPKAAAASSAVITVSESERDTIVKHYPWLDRKLAVVQNGVDSIFSPNDAERDRTILFVGSLSPGKNLRGVLKAFSIICNRIPHKLVLVGSCGDNLSREPELDELIGSIPPERIEFVGHVNQREELRNFYCRADFLIFPSLYEASPFPPVEAMACGTPVIASDIPALRERCEDAVIYCDPHNPNNIAGRMIELATRQELRESLAKRSIEQAKKFSWEEAARRTLEICLGR